MVSRRHRGEAHSLLLVISKRHSSAKEQLAYIQQAGGLNPSPRTKAIIMATVV